jgi:CubicO group peptidase (beta-lactamase class C family)
MWSRLTGPFAAAGTAATASILDAVQLVGAILFGHGPGSEILIEAQTLAAMQRRHISMPGPSVFGDGWGLGWNIADEENGLVAHMGGTSVYTLGSRASGKAAIFLANTPNGAAVGEALTREAIGAAQRKPEVRARQERISGLEGHYASPTFSIDVSSEAGALVMRTSFDERIVPLEPNGERSYLGNIGLLTTEVNFIGDPANGGTPRYLHTALRALPRM